MGNIFILPTNSELIRHPELNNDVVHWDGEPCEFLREGKTNTQPESWEISFNEHHEDGINYSYSYDNKEDYEHDCKILGI
jgi:hypothetical protein